MPLQQKTEVLDKMKSITYFVFLAIMVTVLFFTMGCVPPPQVVEEPAAVEEKVPMEAGLVEIRNDGFNPDTLTVKIGETVIFVNKDAVSHWPASDVHPLHTVYPGSGIHKCNTPEQVNIFDACKRLPPGAEYSFTFNEVGEWGYHDHTRPGLTGIIIVQE